MLCVKEYRFYVYITRRACAYNWFLHCVMHMTSWLLHNIGTVVAPSQNAVLIVQYAEDVTSSFLRSFFISRFSVRVAGAAAQD